MLYLYQKTLICAIGISTKKYIEKLPCMDKYALILCIFIIYAVNIHKIFTYMQFAEIAESALQESIYLL